MLVKIAGVKLLPVSELVHLLLTVEISVFGATMEKYPWTFFNIPSIVNGIRGERFVLSAES